MIGFNELGSKGWLGNQMFQYASLKGIATNRNFDFCVPPNDETRIHNYSLFECFEMSGCKNIGYINAETYYVDFSDYPNSCGFEFNEYLFKKCPDNVNLNGFFQTEKYFEHIKNEIMNDFTFKKEISREASEKIKKFNNPIFLHVRRNDYIKNSSHHHNLGMEYYAEGLSAFDKDFDVLVFSDDVEWCKNQKFFYNKRFNFINNGERFDKIPPGFSEPALNPFLDLCLMSMCSGGIMANSSLSWWGAWLQKNNKKIIVAPNKWFGPATMHLNTKDIIPKEWIKI